MKNAILITAYRSPNQLQRLLKAVDSQYFDCFIHIDKKTDIDPFLKAANGLKNCFFTDKRFSVSLEHSSHVLAIIEAARLAKKSGIYQYYISMTGQCYPLQSNKEISKKLASLYPSQIIDSMAANSADWCAQWGRYQKLEKARAVLQEVLGKNRYETWHGKFFRIPLNVVEAIQTLLYGRPRDNLLKLGYQYSAGSHMWMLTSNAIEFILDRAENDQKLMKIFRSISTPEESFFQTVLTASPFQKDSALNEKHHISKNHDLNRMERSDIFRFICDARGNEKNLRHPLVITMNEKDFIMRSRSLYARKFDEAIDSEILDVVDWLRELPEKERAQISGRPL